DQGTRSVPARTRVVRLEQEPDFSAFATLEGFVEAALGAADLWRGTALAEEVGLDLATETASASGGEKRKVALVAALASEPDLLLLDEPTNHLDIAAIEWLEGQLSALRAAQIIISHDRAFLNSVTRGCLWIDRGRARRLDQGFAAFEAWRDKIWAEEDEARHKLDRKIKAEARWAVEGISARRKRNMGRVRALVELRAERSAMIARQGAADLKLEAGARSGRKVIDAEAITKSFGARQILAPFSLRVMRGDRIAVVGPNGAGKTTLLKMLTGELAPDAGEVRHGTRLDLAVFDQARSAIDPERTLWDALTHDPEMAVDGRADQVMVRGTPRHVVGYLKDFLFDENQARAKLGALSGGERARLLLARIMARQSNLLVLDEPTNDLDVETLDLMQDVLGSYEGTVLLVSHDRDFIDRLATATIALEGDGRATVYAGGWSDYRQQRREDTQRAKGSSATSEKTPSQKHPAPTEPPQGATRPSKLSFTERHRLEKLPSEIEKLTAEIGMLEGLMADPELYTRDRAKFDKASAALSQRQKALAQAEEDWLTLMEKAEAAEG
ncbi:MAG: ATP-binding cassette domain-containing protein, partial [Pseudomonadota bacterium]